MTIETIQTLISSVGFPIVCVIVLFQQNGKMQETLQSLTNTLTQISERLKDLEDSIKGV